jgi:hypothetical protein
VTNLSAPPSAPHSDTSNLPTTDIFGGRNPRLVTEPWREIAALTLLGANTVFLLLGIASLFFVIDGWASGFGTRSAATYGVFVAGLIPVGFPILAVLLAAHVRPIVGRARMITLAAVIQYGVSTVLGLVTFLGAFANDLDSVRATLEGVLYRLAWAGLLALAAMVTLRLWLGLFHVPKPRPVPQYSTPYGQPYPGQPMYPAPGYLPGRAEPTSAGPFVGQAGSPVAPRSGGASGWPSIPPPPMPERVPEYDMTQRLPAQAPPPGAAPTVALPVEAPTPPARNEADTDADTTADGKPAKATADGKPASAAATTDGVKRPRQGGKRAAAAEDQASRDGGKPASPPSDATQRVVPPEPPTGTLE